MAKNDSKKPTEKNGSNGAANGKTDLDARRRFLDRAMEGSAISRATGPGTMPEIAAPSLDSITVHLDAPKAVTRDMLLERLQELLYTAALRLPRTSGETIGPDDEVIVDTVGYCDGELVPFSVREAQMLGPEHDAIPGLRQELVGEHVGTTVQVMLPIHDKHPTKKLRGKVAIFSVRILKACELHFYEPETRDFLERVNLGNTVDKVFETLANEWNEEQRVKQWSQALSRVLGELATRAKVTVEDSIVDREIRRKWQMIEGGLMARLGLPMEQQNLALKAWLDDVDMRTEIKRQIANAAVLRAVAVKENLLTEGEIGSYFDALMPAFGLDPKLVRASIKSGEDPQATSELATNLVFMRAAEHIWSRATVQRS
jgi:trigger factor